MASFSLKSGTQAKYDSIVNKDDATLYFCVDTGKLYKGNVDMSQTNTVTHYDSIITANNEASTLSSLSTMLAPTVKPGDMIILDIYVGDSEEVKDGSGNDIYHQAIYVYTGSTWIKVNSKMDAEDIYFGKDITITMNVGNISLPSGKTSTTIPSTGKNLKQFFETLWAKDTNATVNTNPSVSVTTSATYKEIGTTITDPTWAISFSAGSYKAGSVTQATNVVLQDNNDDGNYVKVENSKGTSTYNGTAKSGTFSGTEFTIVAGGNMTITATVEHSAGSIPVSTLGNACPGVQISAGTKTSSATEVYYGYIPNFRGFTTTSLGLKDIDITTDEGKAAFDAKIKELCDYGNRKTLTVDTSSPSTTTGKIAPLTTDTASADWYEYIYVIPSGLKSSLSVVDKNGLPLTVNKKTGVTIKNVGTATTSYDVFYITNGAPYGTHNITLTWA